LSRQQEFIKTQRSRRQLSTGSTAALIWGLRQIFLCRAKKKKKLKKEHYTGGKDLQFLLASTSEDVSPIPSTWQAEGIFGLGEPDWACYFSQPPLTTG
jgi:hypothetical protein